MAAMQRNFTFRLSDNEKKDMEAQAGCLNVSVSELIRLALHRIYRSKIEELIK